MLILSGFVDYDRPFFIKEKIHELCMIVSVDSVNTALKQPSYQFCKLKIASLTEPK